MAKHAMTFMGWRRVRPQALSTKRALEDRLEAFCARMQVATCIALLGQDPSRAVVSRGVKPALPFGWSEGFTRTPPLRPTGREKGVPGSRLLGDLLGGERHGIASNGSRAGIPQDPGMRAGTRHQRPMVARGKGYRICGLLAHGRSIAPPRGARNGGPISPHVFPRARRAHAPAHLEWPRQASPARLRAVPNLIRGYAHGRTGSLGPVFRFPPRR